jgi:hypothetical protein
MKNYLKLTNAVRQLGKFALVLAGLVLTAIAASASPGEVIPPSALPYGLSYQEWSAKWWQWNLGRDTNEADLVGVPEICREPANHVRFLLGAPGPIKTTRKITITSEASLFFPILTVEADNTACPVSAFTTNTADQLAAEAVGDWSAVSVTTCTIDGVAVGGLETPSNTIYNVISPAFSYTTAEKGNALAQITGEDCIPGGMTIYPTVADGVYLMLSPFSPGKHTIHYVGVVGPQSQPYFTEDITYDLTVVRD